ncbi:MAG TPA: PIG-L deacetylase family protein [Candidatus Angelobacter sp.]|nr:PIG-L deacetylase family protein [Candidatus Angelobacter sp.]
MGSLELRWFDEITDKRMLVYAPHADDEVLGAGGLLAVAARAGWETHVHFATVSGYFSESKAEVSQSSTRMQEATSALQTLNCAGHEVLFEGEEKHLRLDTVPQAELIDFIDRGLKRIRPSIVVFPCRGHYHQDHIALANAVVSAMRPAPQGSRPLVPAVFAYGHAHGGWGGEHYLFRPSVFVDITSVIDIKLNALACYASQVCDEPHPRSLSMVRDQAGAWGAYAGVRYAEAFECHRLLLA